jgi:hypothetical protein
MISQLRRRLDWKICRGRGGKRMKSWELSIVPYTSKKVRANSGCLMESTGRTEL